jgi:Amt family ammonium transporter
VSLIVSGVLTALIGLGLKYTLGWRIAADAESDGIDQSEHAESGYDLGGFAAGAGRGLAAQRPTVPASTSTEQVEGAHA